MIAATLSNDALIDTSPLRQTIARNLTIDLLRDIAREYGKGRLLLVLTTNLDQGRATIWNIGAIAQSGHPRARQLVVDILLASAAMPGVFPPVMMDVSVKGQHYQEMYVDGGMIAQSFLYPPSFVPKVREAGRRTTSRPNGRSISFEMVESGGLRHRSDGGRWPFRRRRYRRWSRPAGSTIRIASSPRPNVMELHSASP